MTTPRKLQLTSLALGCVLSVLSTYLAYGSWRLVHEGVRAEGVVTGTTRSGGSNSRGEMISTIVYPTRDGRDVTISAPGAGSRGTPVDILYRPGDPSGARVSTYRGLWFNATLIGAIGAACLALAAGVWLVTGRQARRRTRLVAAGRPVRALVTEVLVLDQPLIMGKKLMVSGVTAYQLRARGKDPYSGQMREFESANLWREPLAEPGRSVVTVFVDRHDRTRYVVDASTLEPLPAPGSRTGPPLRPPTRTALS